MIPSRALYKSAELMVQVLDEQFKFGRFKVGLDPIIGLIPGVGDVISTMLSFYIVWVAKELQVPQKHINKMIGNIMTDFLIGLVPFVGDIADFAFKANVKNLEILKKYAVLDIVEVKAV